MSTNSKEKNLYKKLPETAGVYLMRDSKGGLLYVGKAGNLRRRVSSYFMRSQDARLTRLVSLIEKIDHIKTDTAIEALILEAKLIKEHEPPFNVREKDDKSFLYVKITNEKFPRISMIRGKDLLREASDNGDKKSKERVYGPFTSASNLREALKVVRRIFPYNIHPPKDIANLDKPCFDAQIGLCPGTCVGVAPVREYKKNVRNIQLFFEGRKDKIIKSLEKDMEVASKKLNFELAEKIRRQIFSLKHIRDIAFISENKIADTAGAKNFRIEGYDISNISGTAASGSMVVFVDGEPDKSQYRKFKIKTVTGADDTAMLREVLERRLKNDWPLPDLFLIDGGLGQINAAKKALRIAGVKRPVVGIAKGPDRKRNDIIGTLPKGIEAKTLIQVRDEAHRFAVAYHKKLRKRGFML